MTFTQCEMEAKAVAFAQLQDAMTQLRGEFCSLIPADTLVTCRDSEEAFTEVLGQVAKSVRFVDAMDCEVPTRFRPDQRHNKRREELLIARAFSSKKLRVFDIGEDSPE